MTTDIYSQQHEMRLEKTYSSGAEEWFCPMCGRRFMMRVQPQFNIMILEAGDELVSHVGSKGGLRIGKPHTGVIEEEPQLSDELRAAIEEALKHIDFDDWEDTPLQ